VKEWTPRDWLEQLREDVQLIAAGAAEQERWLMEHRFPVDEIALQLNDYVLHRLPMLRRAGLMTCGLEAALRSLDDHFGSFSGPENAARWSEDALYDDPVWEEARQQARTILGLIGQIVLPRGPDRDLSADEAPPGGRL
jgi:hypothetical protein